MAARSRAPAIGSAGWILDERHQSNDLVSQELEDFGFSVRNELEWLNEHMHDVLTNTSQNNLDVFKTPGKLRGKTPRTARKKVVAEPRQPLASISSANAQKRTSPAEQSLQNILHKPTTKTRFQIAEDAENAVAVSSPAAKTPVARQLFAKAPVSGKENTQTEVHYSAFASRSPEPSPAQWTSLQATQDTVMTMDDDDIFSRPQTQTTQATQATQATQSFASSVPNKDQERRDTGDSFVSANEAFASKNVSREILRTQDDNVMVINEERQSTDTVVRHSLDHEMELDDADMEDILAFPEPPRNLSEGYSISAETHDALETANWRTHAPEPKVLLSPVQSTTPAGLPAGSPEFIEQDDTVVHHEVEDPMEVDDDVRSPSDNSSPVKPLVRKSSLTFASLPAREPLLAKKSMGGRTSRTSHIDLNKSRNSQLRLTGGKSLGGSQNSQPSDPVTDESDVEEERPQLRREESETTKIHNMTSTQRLFERINMLKQQNEASKRNSQNITSHSQPQASSTAKEDATTGPASQPTYPTLSATQASQEEDDDDDWIAPVPSMPAKLTRPILSKTDSASSQVSLVAAPIMASNATSKLELAPAIETSTPAGSPTAKKYMDGPLSASKAKFYSALRAAKEKIIGSSATSAQVKLEALSDSPMRPKPQALQSTEDVFSSPKRVDKAPSIFSHLRSPSKESFKSAKSQATITAPSSPSKDGSRRTRSSSERQRQKEKDAQEKDAKQRQRAEDKLREIREKEQYKAAAHHQKAKTAAAKTPSAMSSQSSLRQPVASAFKTPVQSHSQQLSRPGTLRTNSREDEHVDSADEMPPPPPPKSNLPTTKTTKAALREPRKIAKPTKEALPKPKAPQKIMVNLNSSRYGQAPPPAARPVPATASKPLPAAPQATKVAVPKPAPAPGRPASALSTKPGPTAKAAPAVAKPNASRVVRQQPPVVDKPKAPTTQQSRADLGAARPVSRMQTVHDANRINIPAVNPAKPAKRAFQPETNEETLHRPAKRPSQLAKMNPITPAHAQFAKGKIPFAEPAHAPQQQAPVQHQAQAQQQIPQIQYTNSEEIALPDILTDSEDEDSDAGFEQPSWVNTPNLRELLSDQQLMDPEAIFGPIAPLNMEAVFPNKERHKRFRERTSSAFWANDQVTEEERRKEREARERLAREGAWTYNPSPRPGPSR